MKPLAERMKIARMEAKLSQAALAARIGVGQSTIASIENSRNDTTGHLVSIATALGVRSEWLADGTGPMRPNDVDAHADAEWPFSKIPRDRFHSLPPDEQSFIEGQLEAAITAAEVRQAKTLRS